MDLFPTLVAVTLAAATAPALATSFDCVQPDFPQKSTSNESVRRVQKQINSWRACYAEQGAVGHTPQDAQKLNAEVDAGIQKWLEATRAATGRNSVSAGTLATIERERNDYLRSVQLR
jgi:hypothetical protein